MAKIITRCVAKNTGELFHTDINVRDHNFIADEPTSFGGKDEGPSPLDYLCSALASCTAITIRMYARRKEWQVDDIEVDVNLVKGSEMESGNNTFFCSVKATGKLDDEQQKRLMEIAKACPVHRLLAKASDIISINTQKTEM